MWIYSDIGFFSIVKKDEEETLTVRSRIRTDLEKFKELHPALEDEEIIESVDSDYRYRIVANEGIVAEVVKELAFGINYSNFKDHVGATDPLRVPVYSALWGITMRLEELDVDEEY